VTRSSGYPRLDAHFRRAPEICQDATGLPQRVDVTEVPMSHHDAISLTGEEDIPHEPHNGFDRWFDMSRRGSTLAREIRGGFATFFTMAYIVVLNPLIIGLAPDANGKTLGITTVAAATALIAGLMTIAMGAFGRYPFAIAAGLGINAFLAFSIAPQMSWPDAMGLIVLEGLLITALVLTNFRSAVFLAIPAELKTAIGVGIGLFIAFIGFVDSGFVRAGSGTPVTLGVGGTLRGWPTTVFIVGLLIMIVLVTKKVKGAILIGIIINTVLAVVVEAIFNIGPSFVSPTKTNPSGWNLNVPKLPDTIVSSPDLSLLGHFSLFGGFQAIGLIAAALAVFSLMLSDFFDTMGTAVAVGAEAGLLDANGNLPGIKSVLVVDSIAAVAGGAASTSSNTTYIESAAGVGEGARTGIASLVTGGLFLVAIFFTPLVSVVPFEAATPALVIVGFLMATQVRNLNFDDLGLAIPSFLTMIVMPFTYSITNGIGAGFVSFVVIRIAQGRAREIHPLMWAVALAFVVYFAIVPIEQVLGVS
jgi:AGZA family xanthine/uracil permease-like MFS transporter